jgi:hypothetical protein
MPKSKRDIFFMSLLRFSLSEKAANKCTSAGNEEENNAVGEHVTDAAPPTHAQASMCYWYGACTGRRCCIERLFRGAAGCAKRQKGSGVLRVSWGSENGEAGSCGELS